MFEFRMPSLGADMEAGTLLEWRIKPGDQVRRGDVVALVDTDKAAIEVEIWQDGVVEGLVVSAGEQVPVGTVLATLRDDGEEAEPATLREEGKEAELATLREETEEAKESVPAQPTSVPAGELSPRVRSSPRARRRARELGVDLAAVKGTGTGGSVTAEDVEAVAETTGESPAGAERELPRAPGVAAERLASLQRGMATAMERSKREIPHYYLETDIDLSRALAWLEVENRRRSVRDRLLYTVLLLKAVSRALTSAPDLNGHWLDGAFRPADGVHVGVAIAIRGGGLLSPAITHTDRKDLDTLMSELRDLVQRARRATLRSSEMNQGSITVTSLGERGVERLFGVIYPPQVALVGFGAIRERPWVEAGQVEARPVITASLSGDHRASDGHRGSRFLTELARLLQTPEDL